MGSNPGGRKTKKRGREPRWFWSAWEKALARDYPTIKGP
jgi:hypothetical protein